MQKKWLYKKTGILLAGCFLWNMPLVSAAELTLENAIHRALTYNPAIKIAAKGQEKAEAQLAGVKGAQGISVRASSSFGVRDVNDTGFSRTNTTSVNLSLPLYTGGKNELNVANAKDSVVSGDLNLGRTQENIVMETVTAYYQILQAEKVVAVDEETVRNYQEHLANVQELYNAGGTSKMDVLRSEVELTNSQQTLLKSQNTYEIAISTLKSVIKLDANEPLTLLDDAQYGTFAQSLDECIDYARNNRKDLQQARIEIEQARRDVGIAASDKKPSVSLSIGNSWDKQIFPTNDNHSLVAGVSVNWNLFDSNVTNSNMKAAEIGVEEAALNLEKKIDAADLEVRQNYLNMKEAEKRLQTTDVAVNKAQEDHFIAKEKYRAGEGILLDVIDAQLALSTAKTNAIQARYDYATYKTKLQNAMGMSGVEI